MKSGKYLITKESIYSHYLTTETTGIPLDPLLKINDLDAPQNYSKIYDSIGKFYKEAGQVSQFSITGNDLLVVFSFLEPLKLGKNEKPYFGTPMIYSEIFFEDQEIIRKRAIDNTVHFYASNLDRFNSIATNVSTNNYQDFCNNVRGKEFISSLLKDSTNISGILEEIIFLELLGCNGGIKTVYSYAYIKHGGTLYPVNVLDVGKYTQVDSVGFTASDILLYTKNIKKFNRLYYFMLLHGFDDFHKQLAIQPYTYDDLNLYYRKFFVDKMF